MSYVRILLLTGTTTDVGLVSSCIMLLDTKLKLQHSRFAYRIHNGSSLLNRTTSGA